MQLEEEKSTSQRLQDNVNQLNNKIRTLRREKDDAEGETEGVTKKLKAARAQIEELEEGNSDLQTQINRLKTSARKARVRNSTVFRVDVLLLSSHLEKNWPRDEAVVYF